MDLNDGSPARQLAENECPYLLLDVRDQAEYDECHIITGTYPVPQQPFVYLIYMYMYQIIYFQFSLELKETMLKGWQLHDLVICVVKDCDLNQVFRTFIFYLILG